jgi:hypothetical protein
MALNAIVVVTSIPPRSLLVLRRFLDMVDDKNWHLDLLRFQL